MKKILIFGLLAAVFGFSSCCDGDSIIGGSGIEDSGSGNSGSEEQNVPVSGVTLGISETEFIIGDEPTTLTVTVAPDNATVKDITWSSSDESVATVSAEGVVTAVGEGTAIITATTKDGNKTTTCTVTVKGIHAAFLSLYDTPEEQIADGDDDETAAWLWFHKTYPNGKFLPFSSIYDPDVLSPYSVLFWMYDLEEETADKDAFKYPEVVKMATPCIKMWCIDGGSMLLWQHAATYVQELGRIPANTWQSSNPIIGYGEGGFNGDTWTIGLGAVLNNGENVIDNSTHPLFKGLEDQMQPGGPDKKCKVLPVKGSGWSEDHNCVFFDYPAKLTGLTPYDPNTYQRCVEEFGIVPLATWDNQMNQISQLCVWEARPCKNSVFKGTFLCVGAGSMNFYMKKDEGKFNVEKEPSSNKYQNNIFTIAKNAIEYLTKVQQTGL